MNWKEFLQAEIESAYATSARLIDKLPPGSLAWKPATGSNWMSVEQLLKHLTNACGAGCHGLVKGNWGLPPGKSLLDLSPEEMMPLAEKMPALTSLEQARALLAEDKVIALRMVEQADEAGLMDQPMPIPWAPAESMILGRQLFRMIQHLDRHNSQLFYYLKLQGVPVNTDDLWGGV